MLTHLVENRKEEEEEGGEGSTEAHPSRVPMTNLGIVIILWGLII